MKRTKPIATILPPSMQPDVAELFDSWSKELDELVAYGTVILDWVGLSGKLCGDEEIPLIMTFRNSLELLDSISILVKNSSIDPAKLQLRALLESLFVISYIVEKEPEQRSYDYLTGHYLRKKRAYLKLDPKTQQGKQFRSEIKNDTLSGKMEVPTIPDLQKHIDRVEKILQKPEYLKSVTEFNRLKNLKGGNPNWYSFFDGPKNIIDLANHLSMSGLYNVLYRQFSMSVHGQDTIDRRLAGGVPGESLITQIRAPYDAQMITQLTITFGIAIYKSFIKHYLPIRLSEFSEWYVNNMRLFYNRISTTQLLEIK